MAKKFLDCIYNIPTCFSCHPIFHLPATRASIFLPPAGGSNGGYEVKPSSSPCRFVNSNPDVVMWMVDTPERRRGLASAAERGEGGLLQTGTWVLPADESALNREKITARLDSRIFFYNFTCDQGEGEPVIWLQELFVIKRVHRCGISSNNRKKIKKIGSIFVHESHSRFYNTFGRWTKGGGMVLEEPDLWLRRKGFLKGIRLRGVFLPFPPFNYLETMVNGTNVTYGIYPEVVRILQVKKTKKPQKCLQIKSKS